jgi:hypothetical protein
MFKSSFICLTLTICGAGSFAHAASCKKDLAKLLNQAEGVIENTVSRGCETAVKSDPKDAKKACTETELKKLKASLQNSYFAGLKACEKCTGRSQTEKCKNGIISLKNDGLSSARGKISKLN